GELPVAAAVAAIPLAVGIPRLVARLEAVAVDDGVLSLGAVLRVVVTISGSIPSLTCGISAAVVTRIRQAFLVPVRIPVVKRNVVPATIAIGIRIRVAAILSDGRIPRARVPRTVRCAPAALPAPFHAEDRVPGTAPAERRSPPRFRFA